MDLATFLIERPKGFCHTTCLLLLLLPTLPSSTIGKHKYTAEHSPAWVISLPISALGPPATNSIEAWKAIWTLGFKRSIKIECFFFLFELNWFLFLMLQKGFFPLIMKLPKRIKLLRKKFYFLVHLKTRIFFLLFGTKNGGWQRSPNKPKEDWIFDHSNTAVFLNSVNLTILEKYSFMFVTPKCRTPIKKN